MPLFALQEEPASTAGTYNPEQWKWDPYTGQYVENQAYKDAMQYGDPAMGTDVVYPDGGGTEHFAPGETPYSFLSAGDNYAGGVKAAVPGSDLYNELKSDADTRNLQGIAKVGSLVGGAAALAGTPWSLGGGGAAPTAGLGPNGLPTGAGGAGLDALAPSGLPSGGAIGSAGSILGGASQLQPGDPGYDPFANMPTNVEDVMTVTGQRPSVPTLPDMQFPDVHEAIGNIPGAISPVITGSINPPPANDQQGGVPDWLANYLLPALNGLGGYLAADKASEAQAAADQAGIDEIKRQYDLTRSDQAPWMTAGTKALGELSDPNASFMSSPDYAFIKKEGLSGVDNRSNAAGGYYSGNALKALEDYAGGIASTDFNNWYGNRLNLAGLGSDSAKSVGALGANAANNTADLLGQKGDARASGLLGKWGSLLGGVNSGYRNYAYGRP